jgi:glycosyltransferase involved in cell wall biosynthesis
VVFLDNQRKVYMKKPLHIVQASHMFLDGGGREEHIFQISKELVALGHKVTVVTSDYLASGKPSNGRRAAKIPGLKVIPLKGYQTNIPPGRIAVPDLIDHLIDMDNIDIIHGHGMGEQVPQDAMYVSKLKNIPFIFTPHFQPWWGYEKLGAQKIWQVLQSTQMPMVMQNSNAVISVSPGERKDFEKFLKSKVNIKDIPNGLDPTIEIPNKEEIKATFEKYKIPLGKRYIIFLGSVTNPRKGAFEAVQAYRQIKEKMEDAHMLVVGPWGSRYINTQPVVEIMQKLAKAKNVTVTGYVSEKEKYALLAGSDVMISPTVYEAFGIVYAESLLCKTPVVATDIGGVPYVVRNDVDGILIKDQKNVSGFAKACRKILEDKKLADKMSENGHTRVKKLFRWDKIAKEIEKVYYSAIK